MGIAIVGNEDISMVLQSIRNTRSLPTESALPTGFSFPITNTLEQLGYVKKESPGIYSIADKGIQRIYHR